MDIRQRIRILYQLRHIVESNGSDEVLNLIDYDIDVLINSIHYNENIMNILLNKYC